MLPVALLSAVLAAPLPPVHSCVVHADEERGDWRPALSGPVETIEVADGQFTVHWTMEGIDAVGEPDDLDGNGLPDGIDRVIDGLETGAAAYLEQGWRPVRMDEGGGETDNVDVYVNQIDAFGLAWSRPVTDGWSCYMELDPDNHGLGEGMAESVAAHELHHCIQYAYTAASHSWMYESTATYEQYLLFTGPAIDLALQALWSQRLRSFHRPIDDVGNRYEYAGFVVPKFVADRGGMEALLALWETLEQTPDWLEAFEAESQRLYGEPFGETFATFASWNLFACNRDDGLHYDPATHLCLLEETPVQLEPLGADATHVAFEHASARFTAAFAEMWTGGDVRPIELDCTVAPEGAEAVVVVTEIDGWGAEAQRAVASALAGGELIVGLDAAVDPAGSFGIVGASVGLEPAVIDCQIARVELPEPVDDDDDDGQGCSCTSSVARTGGAGAAWLLVALGFGFAGIRRTAPRCACAARRPSGGPPPRRS
jgi:hypothetical protein